MYVSTCFLDFEIIYLLWWELLYKKNLLKNSFWIYFDTLTLGNSWKFQVKTVDVNLPFSLALTKRLLISFPSKFFVSVYYK